MAGAWLGEEPAGLQRAGKLREEGETQGQEGLEDIKGQIGLLAQQPTLTLCLTSLTFFVL